MATAEKMRSQFTIRFLKPPEKTALSLPLILPNTHKWDAESGKVTKVWPPPDYTDEKADSNAPPRCSLLTNVKLVIVEEAVKLLLSVDKPLAVLSICGPFRSGKSYFLSRLLGDQFQEVFRVGHTLRACTLGLWISTAVLECEDYAILLVDTQGIDSTSSTECVASKLMSLTALLSSYLIYNSKRVPKNDDVEKLRTCCLLSSAVLCRVTKKELSHVGDCFYPHFLWLLRDVHLDITDEDGTRLEPTEYLHKCVFKLSSDDVQPPSDHAGKLINSFFRSLECQTLSLPSPKNMVLIDIFRQQQNLNPKFSRELSNMLVYIKERVCLKKGMDGIGSINGPAFTELVSTFVNALNSDDLPDFQQGWMAQVQMRCSEIADELVREYKQCMRDSLCGGLPMEEEELLRIHKVVADKKKRVLASKLLEEDPFSLTVSSESIVESFEQSLCQYDESGAIVGGTFYPFAMENYDVSRTECEALWKKVVDDCGIHKKFHDSIKTLTPVDITHDVNKVEEEYKSKAVGPAKGNVFNIGHNEIIYMSSILHKLPGEPSDLKVIGVGHNMVKLSWDPPVINPQAVNMYHVKVCMDGGEWVTVKETSKTKALITNLFDKTDYKFSVVAASNLMKGTEICQSATTKISEKKEVIMGLIGGAFPVVSAVNYFIREHNRARDVSLVKAASVIALTTLLTPVTMIGFPLSGPLLAISLASDDQLRENCRSEGDLTPEDD